MQVAAHSQELLSSLTNLADEDRETVLLMVLLLARVSESAQIHANEMIEKVVSECPDSPSARSKLDEILAYLLTAEAR